MSRGGGGMSGANNIPLGARSGGGSLAAAASTLGGVSLLNPAYLGDDAPPPPRRSKFGPPVEGKSNILNYFIKSTQNSCNFSNWSSNGC